MSSPAWSFIPGLQSTFSVWFRPHYLDDSVDRLHYFVTSSLLLFFALMISAKQFVGSPIQCWLPKQLKDYEEAYAEEYCFTINTYSVPEHQPIPDGADARKATAIPYYQWVPIVLALQSIAFYAPNWIWKTTSKITGLDVPRVVAEAHRLKNKPTERTEAIKELAGYLGDAVGVSGRGSTGHCSLAGSWFTVFHLLTKLFYILNLACQFFILNRFIGADCYDWALNMLFHIVDGRKWSYISDATGLFPKVTLCDFLVRKLGNSVLYTVQCVLYVNALNEKIYFFLWFWFLFLLSVSLLNLISIICQIAFTRESSCKSWLYGVASADERSIRRFAMFGLKNDGYLAVCFIERHAGSQVAREIAQEMFGTFTRSQFGVYRRLPEKDAVLVEAEM